MKNFYVFLALTIIISAVGSYITIISYSHSKSIMFIILFMTYIALFMTTYGLGLDKEKTKLCNSYAFDELRIDLDGDLSTSLKEHNNVTKETRKIGLLLDISIYKTLTVYYKNKMVLMNTLQRKE